MYEYKNIIPTEDEYLDLEKWLNDMVKSGWEFVACANTFRISASSFIQAGWIFRKLKSNKEKKNGIS